MKIPTSLLTSITAGVLAMSTLSSCSLNDFSLNGDEQACEENCTIVHDHEKASKRLDHYDCPGCGLG